MKYHELDVIQDEDRNGCRIFRLRIKQGEEPFTLPLGFEALRPRMWMSTEGYRSIDQVKQAMHEVVRHHMMCNQKIVAYGLITPLNIILSGAECA